VVRGVRRKCEIGKCKQQTYKKLILNDDDGMEVDHVPARLLLHSSRYQ